MSVCLLHALPTFDDVGAGDFFFLLLLLKEGGENSGKTTEVVKNLKKGEIVN